VAPALSALADDTKSVVLHDAGAADATEKALLHPALKAQDRNFRRGNFDGDGDFAEGDPGDEDASMTVSSV
jgi:hypothetical protein